MALLPSVTATWPQATAYLAGVCLFSISFLVFLNASIPFAVTDIIGQRHGVGDIVGTLSFADEMLGLAACPLFGMLSDRIGVRTVSSLGFFIVASSFVVLPSARAPYPDLLLVRLLFSLGAAACTTMISAILPTMNIAKADLTKEIADERQSPAAALTGTDALDQIGNRSSLASFSSELTITPARYGTFRDQNVPLLDSEYNGQSEGALRESSNLAGFVGMSTGLGALLAVAVFLPLPALYAGGQSKAAALSQSFYTVAGIALIVGVLVWLGLAGLPDGADRNFGSRNHPSANDPKAHNHFREQSTLFYRTRTAVKSLVTDPDLTLACLGGFVARSASTGISLFVPLFVNAYFIRRGICTEEPGELLKQQCKRAYLLASMLTGISQLIALLSAPLFGYLGARLAERRPWANLPLGLAAICGVIGGICFGFLRNPDPFADVTGAETGSRSSALLAIPAVTLMGVSQIGAIVCSLSLLARGIQRAESLEFQGADGATESHEDTSPAVSARQTLRAPSVAVKRQLKGTIAGLYSLFGGAGILILSKTGGLLFDRVSIGGPFFMLAGFNGVLASAVVGMTLLEWRRGRILEDE